ncbi:MAG: TIGR04282 family arsenosugar biosynthesis glycosyltransferase [Gammaproteobacteria bacterium]|nr:TIGR04282 family arsenosugar biosynthesis glycosyltransferase [Gammaproteobacteria bacterium]
MSGNRPIPLYLFAKAPVPGEVKTRMYPRMDAAGCARLAATMLTHSVENLHRHWPGKLVLTVSPHAQFEVFRSLRSSVDMDLEVQIEGDLGSRMMHVLKRGVKESGYSAVMGCDIPHLPGETLENAYELLTTRGNVIGPATDGGFYFLGVNQENERIFRDVRWGESTVLSRVRANFSECGLALASCAESRDIDTWDDLCWLAETDARYREFTGP